MSIGGKSKILLTQILFCTWWSYPHIIQACTTINLNERTVTIHMGCNTQIGLRFWNTFKDSCFELLYHRDNNSSWITVLNKQSLYLIEIFLKWQNHLNKLLHRTEGTKRSIPCGEDVLLKSLCPRTGNNNPLKT